MDQIKDLEKKIGYTFKKRQLAENAMAHSSYANERHCKSNERLEFLGDSVLSLIVSENLYNAHAEDSEGDLSKIRASLVCEHGLFELAKKIELPQYIHLGVGEEKCGGRNRPSLVSDAFEALLAAIFLDSDFETAKKWLLSVMREELISVSEGFKYGDYKTMLQEHTQKGGKGKVTYALIKESGPDHDKSFICSVSVDGTVIADGEGKTKKEAEQRAAQNALKKL